MQSDSREQSPVRATDALANERTYLAYVRTALAFIAFGFVIARFSLFAREFDALVAGSPGSTGISTGFGTTMAVFGILMAIFGAWRYAASDRGLREGRVVTLPTVAGYAIALFVVVVGAIVAAALMFYR